MAKAARTAAPFQGEPAGPFEGTEGTEGTEGMDKW
jgi:hypothetical protein